MKNMIAAFLALLTLAVLASCASTCVYADRVKTESRERVISLTGDVELYITADGDSYIRMPFAPYTQTSSVHIARLRASVRLLAELSKLATRPTSFFRSKGLTRTSQCMVIRGAQTFIDIDGKYMVMPIKGVTIRSY